MSGMTKTPAGGTAIRPFRVPTSSDACHPRSMRLTVSGQ
jgi:hypothetical protein